MEQHDAGLVQSNEESRDTVETTKFGSGFHDDGSAETQPTGREHLEPTVREDEPVSEAVLGEPSQPATPEQAFIGADGQVHQVPPELIGPDGKMLPLNEKTMRKLRNKYFTVRHDALPCGHKVDRVNQPKTNCETCWWGWLNTHGQLVQTAHEFIQQYGKERLVSLRGKVFVKMFLRFMSTVNHLIEEQKAQEKLNDNQGEPGPATGSIEGSEGEGSASSAIDGGRQTETGEVVND
jgi:hypothetical protein